MHTQKPAPATDLRPLSTRPPTSAAPTVRRITSAALLQERREVEIEHEGKIYRLRVTQLNKLILTA